MSLEEGNGDSGGAMEEEEVETEAPKFITVNGTRISLEQCCACSDFFQTLLKGGFGDAGQDVYWLKHETVATDSEAWAYYLLSGHVVNENGAIRWHDRWMLAEYLNGGELPPWFLRELRIFLEISGLDNIKAPSFAYLESLWQTLICLGTKPGQSSLFVSFLERGTKSAARLAPDMWRNQSINPDLVHVWCHALLPQKYPGLNESACWVEAASANFLAYLSKASAGLLPLKKWPKGVVLSGGSLVDAYFQLKPEILANGRDFDLWIWDEVQANEIVAQILAEFRLTFPNLIVWEKITANIMDVLLPGQEFHIQILFRAGNAPWSVPLRFDLDYVRAYMAEPEKLYLLPEAKRAWETRTVQFWNTKTPLRPDRLEKAAAKGFAINVLPMSPSKTEPNPQHWFHPKLSDPFSYVETITLALCPESKLWKTGLPQFREAVFRDIHYGDNENENETETKLQEAKTSGLLELPSKSNDFSNGPPLIFTVACRFIIQKQPFRENLLPPLYEVCLFLNPNSNPAHLAMVTQIRKFEEQVRSRLPSPARFQFRITERPEETLKLMVRTNSETQYLDKNSELQSPPFANADANTNTFRFGEVVLSVAGLWSSPRHNSWSHGRQGIYFKCLKVTEFSGEEEARTRLLNVHRLKTQVTDF